MNLNEEQMKELSECAAKYPNTQDIFERWHVNQNDLEDMVRTCDENNLSYEAIFHYANQYDPTTKESIVGRIIAAMRIKSRFRRGNKDKLALDIFSQPSGESQEAPEVKSVELKPTNKHDFTVTVHLTANQKSALEKGAKRQKMSKSEWMRNRVFGQGA